MDSGGIPEGPRNPWTIANPLTGQLQLQLQLQLVPLLAVLLLSKVTIVVARSPSLPLLALNLLLGCVFEGSFAALLLFSVACLGARVDAGGHRCYRGRCQLGALRFLLLPNKLDHHGNRLHWLPASWTAMLRFLGEFVEI